MPVDWDRQLTEWSVAGVVDAETAERIRGYERAHATSEGARWSVWLALIFGVVLVGAGVLLLVSAVWDEVPPLTRLALVVAMVALLHLVAALAWRWSARIGAAVHVVGSLALGPAIFMAGDVLGLDGHWPAAVMLWAVGAFAAWLVRRDIAHFALVAVLVPAWLLSEWGAIGEMHDLRASIVGQAGAFLLALSYLTCWPSRRSRRPGRSADVDRGDADPLLGGATRRQAMWCLGLVAFMPSALALGIQAGIRMQAHPWFADLPPLPAVRMSMSALGWTTVILAPLAVAALLRGTSAWLNLVAAAWVVVLALLPTGGTRMLLYAWLAMGCIGLGAWGIRETRSALINLATLCFGFVVLFFYFDNLMDKMGRAASLIGLGLLFLAGGYVLDGVRRRMVARAAGGVV